MRYFFHCGFNGFNYRGWQRQANVLNVQQVLETTLSQVLKESITVIGCGRTDAQVHASQYFFHIDVMKAWDYDLLFRLNKILPADIAIFDIIPVSENQHARYDAKERTYDYFIHTYKDPFLSTSSSLYLVKDLHLDKMKAASLLLTKYNDFRPLCKSPDTFKHTLCTVSSAEWFVNKAGDRLRFEITSNRFLNKMVRLIVGKLIEIGLGNLSVDELEHYLITLQIPPTFEPAYPQGLYLSKIVYPFLNLPEAGAFAAIKYQQPWTRV